MSNVFYPMISLGLSNYYINDEGIIYSANYNRFLAPQIDRRGYLRYHLHDDQGNPRNERPHRLVMMTFCPRPDMSSLQVDHINGNKWDNRLENLRWVTNRENYRYGMELGLLPNALGSDEEVHEICRRIQSGESVAAIARDTGKSADAIAAVRLRRNWKHISQNYTFPPCRSRNLPSEETIRQMIYMIKNGYTDAQIIAALGVREETVFRTRHGRIYKALYAEIMGSNS